MTRPTPEQIKEARQRLVDMAAEDSLTDADMADLRTLLAATEPPTDEEIIARYNAFLARKGYEDRGHAIWFADGVEAFIGRQRPVRSCVCGKCPVKP